MRKSKRILSLVLSIVLIFGLLPVSAMAKEVNTLVLNAACLFSGTNGETTEFTFTTGAAGVYRFDLEDTNPKTHGGYLKLYSGSDELDPYSADYIYYGDMQPKISQSWNLNANTTYRLTHMPDEDFDPNTTHHYSLKPTYAGVPVNPVLSAGQSAQIKFLNVGEGCKDYYVAHFNVRVATSGFYRIDSTNRSYTSTWGQLPQTVYFKNGKDYSFSANPASQSSAPANDTITLTAVQADCKTLTETSPVSLTENSWISFTAPSAGTYCFKAQDSEGYHEFITAVNDETFLADYQQEELIQELEHFSMQSGETVYFYVAHVTPGTGQMSVTKIGGSSEPDPEPDPDPAAGPLKKIGTFTYWSQFTDKEASYDYSYDESWFLKSGTEYQHDLARMSIRMAMAAARTTPVSIKDLFDQLSFDYSNESIVYPNPTRDSIGYAIGSKRILDENGGEFTLVAVAVRGGGYKDEWASNITIGKEAEHKGFKEAGEAVAEAVQSYISEYGTGNTKVWITGYSRAAAASNIAAQRLNEWSKKGNVKGLSTDGIYAYCFECPQGARTTSASYETGYRNIHNIVNDYDIVTKVAPKDDNWNYSRYGITYQIPTAGLIPSFSDRITNMRAHYIDIVRSANDYTISLDSAAAEVASVTAQPGSQAGLTDVIVSIIASVLVSPENISPALQEKVRDLAAQYLGSEDEDVGAFILKLAGLGLGVKAVYNDWIISALTVVTGLEIAQAHYPELCLAWMDTIDGAGGFADSRTRKLYVNCPVDVSVYDSSGRLVAQIVNDSAENSPEDGIPAFVDFDGQKIIMLPSGEKYRVELTATGNGEMTYMVSEYDVNDGSADKLVSYHQIPIAAGDAFTGTVENLEQTSDAQYPLEGASGAISPTVKQQGDDVRQYSVTVKTSGNGAAYGGGRYLSGEYARLVAEPDSGASFLGWYVNGERISKDTEYRMLVTADAEVVAKFTSTKAESGGYPSAPGNCSITVKDSTHGAVTTDRKTASSGSTVTLTISPEQGWTLETLTVTNASGKEIDLNIVKVGEKYTFKMPSSNVTVAATFMEDNSILNSFVDVPPDSYYYDAVLWAVKNSITTGTDAIHFSPDGICTRAQAVTFLWRAAGSPAPKSSAMPFIDVPAGSYYYNAVLWAVENGITKGTSDTAFSPDKTCTRAQIVTFLWRSQNAPAAGSSNPFTDVAASDYYADAVLWAVKNDITKGTGTTTFSPDADCTRAQIVTFLWRTLA